MARRAKGEGTLYQAKDKSWVYQYKVDGQRKTKRFQRKADAKAFIEALTAATPESIPPLLSISSQPPQQKSLLSASGWTAGWRTMPGLPLSTPRIAATNCMSAPTSSRRSADYI